LNAYGYAEGQSTTVIGADADVTFDLGATPYPHAGFSSVPAPGGSAFVVLTNGVYEFDWYISGLPSTNFPLVFTLYRNGAPAVGQYSYRSQTTASATDVLNNYGHGLIQLVVGDIVTVHNRTVSGSDTVAVTSVPLGGEAGANRTFSLKRIN